MKFRFCGGLDAPEWLLGEIAVLTQLDANATEVLARQVVRQIVQPGTVDYEAVENITEGRAEDSDVKALMAAVHYILSNAAKYGVAEGTVNTEIQQLGLPRETSSLVTNVYKESLVDITEALKRETLSLPSVGTLQWRVDAMVATSDQPNINSGCVQMAVGEGENRIEFEMTAEKFGVLHNELKNAQSLMKE